MTEVIFPVNENGSFEFDKVLKAGDVYKRTRKTKHWRSVYIVLRPNLLSIYKSPAETKLRHQVTLSDLTAVARQKDPKGKVDHIFGLFSPSRNYHISCKSEKEAQEWVDLVSKEAKIDLDEESMNWMGPIRKRAEFQGRQEVDVRSSNTKMNLLSSSSETDVRQPPPTTTSPVNMRDTRKRSLVFSFSGNEQGSFSEFSDSGCPGLGSEISLSNPNNNLPSSQRYSTHMGDRQPVKRSTSQGNGFDASNTEKERVVCQGWLSFLKSKGGVRQWKKLWVVLRPRNLAFYRNQDEYSAKLIIPFPQILNAVDIDPVSKSKRSCMQLITEDRNYRFCCQTEDLLAKWLGAFKSLLAKRREPVSNREATSFIKGNGNIDSDEP